MYVNRSLSCSNLNCRLWYHRDDGTLEVHRGEENQKDEEEQAKEEEEEEEDRDVNID